ncbi:Diaminopimelate decarboxylase [Actinomadura rubteroloni]|uniref:Diaminopimelate decarboxylase n=1 Tax=Actinomadura rubteroloni TaxID=1926885 RepID=A0A2P4UN47_9ACTN|nr:diaminopimelate decarboxylase [Actinomadura rubteroloni]POM26468.1 Diaminopimelate decarboxylase [Actinomadura rubteroloni]
MTTLGRRSHFGNTFDAGIWPRGTGCTGDGAMSVAGHDLRTLAAEFGTPLFVLDHDDLIERCGEWESAFASVTDSCDIYYAGKAFLCGAVAQWINAEGLGLDVCTGGELAVALRSGFPADRMTFHGNNKSVGELRTALNSGVGKIIVDSFEEIERVAGIAAEIGVRPKIMIRLTLGVRARTHDAIATAHEDQKFGFSVADGSAGRAVEEILHRPDLHLVGVHTHIGSQIFGAEGFMLSADRAVNFLGDVQRAHGIALGELNLGGGAGIAYTADENPLPVSKLAGELVAAVTSAANRENIPMPRLAVEPGRALIGPSTLTLYEVGTVKPVTVRDAGGSFTRTYVSVDGGMSDNMRPALYGATCTSALVSRPTNAPDIMCRLVGKHCEAGDILIRDLMLPGDVQAGDLVAVAATGAYNRSMASNYNLVPRPAVVAVARDLAPRLIIRRETLDDLVSTDMTLTSECEVSDGSAVRWSSGAGPS